MLATFEFDLEKQEDQEKFALMCNAQDMANFLWEFSNYMRSQLKHADVPDDLEKVRGEFYILLEEHNVSKEIFS